MNTYHKRLIAVSEKFLDTLNILLIFSMIVVTVGVIGLFFRDILAFYKNNFAQGFSAVLSSLIMLWVLMELISAQIESLKGGKFNVGIFIIVAMVAFIRKLMISTFQPDKIIIAYFPLVTILVLGIVYWLVTKAETK